MNAIRAVAAWLVVLVACIVCLGAAVGWLLCVVLLAVARWLERFSTRVRMSKMERTARKYGLPYPPPVGGYQKVADAVNEQASADILRAIAKIKAGTPIVTPQSRRTH